METSHELRLNVGLCFVLLFCVMVIPAHFVDSVSPATHDWLIFIISSEVEKGRR